MRVSSQFPSKKREKFCLFLFSLCPKRTHCGKKGDTIFVRMIKGFLCAGYLTSARDIIWKLEFALQQTHFILFRFLSCNLSRPPLQIRERGRRGRRRRHGHETRRAGRRNRGRGWRRPRLLVRRRDCPVHVELRLYEPHGRRCRRPLPQRRGQVRLQLLQPPLQAAHVGLELAEHWEGDPEKENRFKCIDDNNLLKKSLHFHFCLCFLRHCNFLLFFQLRL